MVAMPAWERRYTALYLQQDFSQKFGIPLSIVQAVVLTNLQILRYIEQVVGVQQYRTKGRQIEPTRCVRRQEEECMSAVAQPGILLSKVETTSLPLLRVS